MASPYACCPTDGEPLISTFKKRGKEFVCMVCGNWWEWLQPRAGEITEERTARYEFLKAEFDAGKEPGSVSPYAAPSQD